MSKNNEQMDWYDPSVPQELLESSDDDDDDDDEGSECDFEGFDPSEVSKLIF